MKVILFLSVLVLLSVAMLKTYETADPDLWHRLALGRHFINTGSLSEKDIFSYMPTKPLWIDHEWGSGVLFYLVFRSAGTTGLLVLKTVIFILILLMTVLINQTQNPSGNLYQLIFFTVTLLGLFQAFFLTVRCHVFTYFFITLWIFLLELLKKRNSVFIYAAFLISTLLWVNLHGGFLSGIGLVCVYCFAQLFRKERNYRYFTVLMLILPVLLINPYAEKFLLCIYHAVTMPRPMIGEWRPMDLFGEFADYPGYKIILVIALITCIIKIVLKERKLNLEGLLFCLVTLVLSLKSRRHNIFFVITATCFVYPHVFELLERASEYTSRVHARFIKLQRLASFAISSGSCIFLSVFSIYALTTVSDPFRIPPEMYPVGPVRYIRDNHLKGNILVGMNYGSYTLWNLYPDCRVASDGRYEAAYDTDAFQQVHDFFLARPGWKEFLDQYPHDFILLKNDEPVFSKLLSLPGWKLVFKDEYSSLFSK